MIDSGTKPAMLGSETKLTMFGFGAKLVMFWSDTQLTMLGSVTKLVMFDSNTKHFGSFTTFFEFVKIPKQETEILWNKSFSK